MPIKTQQRVNHFGIEVANNITWQGWEPGGEYTKDITLKNVQIKTQKLKYRGPSTRFFTTRYPKPIVLSSGTSYTLPVTFRPLEKGQYEDHIEFETRDGTFSVPMQALLPKHHLAFPEHLNFTMCAVKDSIELSFEMTNTSELVTSFQWQISEPFEFIPASGTLAPNTSCQVKALFCPKAALVYVATALCTYGEGPNGGIEKSITVEGIGKYPHLVVTVSKKKHSSAVGNTDEVVVNFDDVPIQSTATKFIELHNLSPVSAPFQVLQPSFASSIDTAYTCSQYHGVVAPESSTQLKISFSPSVSNFHYIDYFEVVALGASHCSVVKCCGYGKGPKLMLDNHLLDFGVVEFEKRVTRTFKITNYLDVKAAYQFLIDCKQSVFKLETSCGMLNGKGSETILCHFNPSHPINYYRRLTCLVQNQDPLYIDLIGTCHSEQVKPAPLLPKHLERYKTHVSRGLSKTPSEELNEMLKKERLQLDADGALVVPEDSPLDIQPQPAVDLSPMEELFSGRVEETCLVEPHASLDIQHVDFGRCPDSKVVEQKTVNITNHTKGKVTCVWMKDENGVFSVIPEQCDILPLRTASFRVTFRPNAANQFFNAELECYVFYKCMRDYRLVEDSSFCPPWCLTLGTSGHTFIMGTETFLPRFQWDSKNIVFPAVSPEEVSYSTLLLTNTGDNPINFAFEKDHTGVFSCQPSEGLLRNKYQLVVFRMMPTENRTFRRPLKCRLNDADKYTEELLLVGSAEIPQLQLENGGTLFFKPTCTGTTSLRPYAVRNTSRIPLQFAWKIPGADATIVKVEPSTGTILPNENQFHTFAFSPREEINYVVRAKLFAVGSAQSSGGKKYLVRVVGEGSVGKIVCEQTSVEFGDVVIGRSSTQELLLYNSSDCSLHYRLIVDQAISGPYNDEETARDVLALELDKFDGVLPARTTQKIRATIFPARRVDYNVSLSYELLSQFDNKQSVSREKTFLVNLHCKGVYPTVAVTDARCLGSGKALSKSQIWSLFSLENLNVCLDSDPSPSELMYTTATRHSTKCRVPVYTRAIMDFNFGAAPVGAEPCILYLNLHNTGTVPSEWAFLYPSDLQLELEYWAETGEYDTDELHEMQVMDNKMFSVEPRNGLLSPGQSCTVVLSYKHLFCGINKLPVLLKVMGGREILLNFVGVTVVPESYYVHFSSNKHLFEPVAIGGSSPPLQLYELYNGGAKPVTYEISMDPLAQVEAQNYGCRIFECLNPNGEIPPGCTALIHWVFAPLEAKTYLVDVPITIVGGESMLVTFTGVGYDQRIMGDTMMFGDHSGSSIPDKQLIQVPEQLAYLSEERVSFANVPLYSLKRKNIFLTNKSLRHTVSFRWLLEGSPAENVLIIEPDHGYLTPQKSVLLKISFFSFGAPVLYDLDIICEITDETEMSKFNQKFIEWSNKQEEKRYTFTITEADVKADRRPHSSGDNITKPSSGNKCNYSKSEGNLRKFQALPPIGSNDKKESKKKSKKHFTEEEDAQQPVPPETFLLHLGVVARTHSLYDFHRSFPPEVVETYVIDRRFVQSQDRNTQEKQELSALESCSRKEMSVISDVLAVILRELLDDESLHKGFSELGNEPVPYYRQLCANSFESDDEQEKPGGELDQEGLRDVLKETKKFDVSSASCEAAVQVQGGEEGLRRSREIIESAPTSPFTMTNTNVQGTEDKGGLASQRQEIRKLPEFESLLEAVLENTLLNVMTEASRGEVVLTARPRVIALPPNRQKPNENKTV